MLVKYYLRDNINDPFENFTLGFRNAWARPGTNYIYLFFI